MLFKFYELYRACLKYDFSFILDAERYRSNCLRIILKPNNESVEIILSDKSYRKLFIRAIAEMKDYRKKVMINVLR